MQDGLFSAISLKSSCSRFLLHRPKIWIILYHQDHYLSWRKCIVKFSFNLSALLAEVAVFSVAGDAGRRK